MYTSKNLEQKLEAYGNPASLAYTLGKTVPEQEAVVPERHLKTTNTVFFSELPKVDISTAWLRRCYEPI